jgi:cytochrome c oxidase subunit 2
MRDALHSAFEAFGPVSGSVLQMTWVLFLGAGIILLLVVALTVYAVAAPPERRRWLGTASAIVAGGVVFPVATLTALLVYGLVMAREDIDAGATMLRIEVIGEQWWWRVRYLDADGIPQFETANEIRIPVAQVVELTLKSSDVIHSFWIPSLGGKMDMIPGHVNRLRLSADRPGVFRGQCAEYCGGAHAMMALYVVAEAPGHFADWLANQRAPAAQPQSGWLKSGQALFMSRGCVACHRIRGTQAFGVLGPDLTHVGSRLSIAAGSFPNHSGTLAGWIADSQNLKPNNRMPSFPVFHGTELRSIAEYLESLK